MDQLNRLAELLKEKSEALNLFSKGDREKLSSKHIPDSLAVLNFWELPENARVMDIGTGGGLPGLALALSCSEALFTLVDAREKKVDAVRDIAEALNLSNVRCLAGRFEELAHDPDEREQFDTVTARAVAPLPVLLEYASGFLKAGGTLYAWKGPGYEEELSESEKAQGLMQLRFESKYDYTLPEGEERSILCFKKLTELSEDYPRPDGVPKKKPL